MIRLLHFERTATLYLDSVGGTSTPYLQAKRLGDSSPHDADAAAATCVETLR